MPMGSSSLQWDLRVPWGSKMSWNVQLWQGDGTEPYALSPTFEYVVKANVTDSSPLIRLRSDVPASPVPSGAGLLSTAVSLSLNQLTIALYPPATSALVPPVTYWHALWMNYGDPVNAQNLFWGQFFLDTSIQP